MTIPRPWLVFTAAPHRMMFFGGAVQLVVVLLYWSAELAGRYTGAWSPPATVIPALWAHMALMLYGLFGFFFFGFLMTTYPRWMRGKEIPRPAYVRTFLLLAAGTLLFYLGLFTAVPVLLAGVVLWLAGMASGMAALWRVYRTAPTDDRFYETWLNGAFCAGWLGLAAFAAWLLDPRPLWLQLSLNLGLWLYLAPVLSTVAHRMIPFFTGVVVPDYREVRPRWSLWLLNGGLVLHGLLALLDLRPWLFAVDLPLAALAFWHSRAWRFRAALSVRLLAVLHIAYLWFGIALLLYGLQSLALAVTGTLWLDKAPLHAFGIGFVTSMLIGMASRVSLGHSGRPLEADTFIWICFLGVSLTALLRIAGEWPPLWPALGVHPNLLAALAWLGFVGAWVARFLPIYLRPRIDGRPG